MTYAPDIGRTAEELKAGIIAALNAAFRGFSFPGERWSTGYEAEMAADALLSGPLAPILQEAATARKERDEALERARTLYDDRTAECETASLYWREARRMHNDLIALAKMYGEACGELARIHWFARRCAISEITDTFEAMTVEGEAMEARAQAAEQEAATLRARLRETEKDADHFRALMRCGRIKPQGSAGVHPGTGERTYPDEPGSVHFGAEFWVQPEATPSNATIWGRFCLRALAEDILAYQAAKAAPLPDSDTGGKS